MKTFSLPWRLWMVAGLFLFFIPLMIVEIVLGSNASWWNLPIERMKFWIPIVTGCSLVLIWAVLLGKKWVLHLSAAIGIIWCFSSVGLVLRVQSFWLGFFVLCFAFFLIALWTFLKLEMTRSFFDPNMHWYQGLPVPLPELACTVIYKNIAEPVNFRVCRFDRNGAFLFMDNVRYDEAVSKSLVPTKKENLHMIFSFRDKKAEAHGTAIRILMRGFGIGVRFEGMSADSLKELGDFVEVLSGAGYS